MESINQASPHNFGCRSPWRFLIIRKIVWLKFAGQDKIIDRTVAWPKTIFLKSLGRDWNLPQHLQSCVTNINVRGNHVLSGIDAFLCCLTENLSIKPTHMPQDKAENWNLILSFFIVTHSTEVSSFRFIWCFGFMTVEEKTKAGQSWTSQVSCSIDWLVLLGLGGATEVGGDKEEPRVWSSQKGRAREYMIPQTCRQGLLNQIDPIMKQPVDYYTAAEKNMTYNAAKQHSKYSSTNLI